MGYKAETVSATVSHLNFNFFLPAIQREFVWSTDKVIQLFDSLMRGYPISSFLYWELKPENRDKWQVYRFVENAREDGSHNELANTDGVQQLTLVLDGQQRLTSPHLDIRVFANRAEFCGLPRPDGRVFPHPERLCGAL